MLRVQPEATALQRPSTHLAQALPSIPVVSPSLIGSGLPLILTAAQVCEVLQIGRKTLWRYRKSGILPYIKVRGRLRFRLVTVERLLATREVGA